jgi:hypothetical protein
MCIHTIEDRQMKIQTSELTGAALDWAAAKCDNVDSEWLIEDNFFHEHYKGGLCYSTDWSQGGPIIEREKIGAHAYWLRKNNWAWRAVSLDDTCKQYGPTPLIAAMRCYVASKLGDTVDIPEELL